MGGFRLIRRVAEEHHGEQCGGGDGEEEVGFHSSLLLRRMGAGVSSKKFCEKAV
jgi:hypothetical protein